MKWKGVGMMKKQKDLGETDERAGSSVGGCVGVCGSGGGSLVPFLDSGDLCMSPEYVVLADMSDSDGYCGPGISRFPLLPIPSARPLHPCDKTRRRCVSWSATIFVLVSLTHRTTYSLAHSFFFFSLTPSSLLEFCVAFSLFIMFKFFAWFLSISSFPLTRLLFENSCFTYFNSVFSSLFLLVLFLHYFRRQSWSGWLKNKAGGQHLPGFRYLFFLLISHHLSTSKALF